MLTKQIVIDALADRIERAYRLRRIGWRGMCSTPRVWSIAAKTLLLAHEENSSLPIDPALFVAAQPFDAPFIDPWSELTRPESIRHYQKRIREIVRSLRHELTGEVRHAERRIEQGQAIRTVLLSRTQRLSALGRMIVAYRAGRLVLAKRFVQEAMEQHRACPLYRQACAGFLPDHIYPVPELEVSPIVPAETHKLRTASQVHLN